MEYFLGLDVGTTNIKAAVYDVQGKEYAYASEAEVIHHSQEGYSEFDPQEIWEKLSRCIKKVLEEVPPEKIHGICTSSMAEAGVPLDSQGEPLFPIIAWYDPRTRAQSMELEKALGGEKIYSITGQILGEKYGICKIMWMKEHQPAVMEKTKHWLSVQDYVIYRLSGAFATDYTTAGRTLAFDINQLTWSKEILRTAGVSEDLFPQAYPGGTKVGTVSDRAGAECGLQPGTPVVTGGHDHCCAAIGMNIFQEGVALDSMGTAEVLMLATNQLTLTKEAYQRKYSVYPHCGPKLYRILASNSSCGSTIEWMFKSMAGIVEREATEEGVSKYQKMEELAGASIHPVLFYPFIRGNIEFPGMTGSMFGLTDTTEVGDLLNGAMNGLCYEVKRHLEGYEALLQERITSVRCVGGLAKSPFIMQKKADINQRRVEVPKNREAACYGAAMLAAVGVGATTFETLEESVKIKAVYEPREKNSEQQQQDYQQYLRIRNALVQLK